MDSALSALSGNPNLPRPDPCPLALVPLLPLPPPAALECPCESCLEPAAALAPPTAGLTAPRLREYVRRGSPFRFEPQLSPCYRPGLQHQPCAAAPHRKPPPPRPPLAPRPPGPGPNQPLRLRGSQMPERRWCPLDNTKRLSTETCLCIISLRTSYASKVLIWFHIRLRRFNDLLQFIRCMYTDLLYLYPRTAY